jgi:hypothetical protein
MASQSSIHFFFNWTKERIDEMDATVASLESKAGELRSESRSKADQVIADLRKKRDEFESTIKKQAEAGEAARDATMKRLEAEWRGFETEVNNYLQGLGKDIKQEQAVKRRTRPMRPQRNSRRSGGRISTRWYRACRPMPPPRRRSCRSWQGRGTNPGPPSTPPWLHRVLLSIAPIRLPARRSSARQARVDKPTHRVTAGS